MKSNIRRTVSGRLAPRDLGNGWWQLSVGAPAAAEIYLRIATAGAADVLRAPGIGRLELEWRDDGVSLVLSGAKTVGYLKASSAIVHESQATLYERLPLAAFEPNARRFWKRVFTLMRVPGGRFLLGLITRRNQ